MQNLILFSLSALSQIILCAIIFYSSRGETGDDKNSLRLKFYLLGASIAIWCASQYAYEVSYTVDYQQWALRIGVIVTIFVAYFFLLFAREIMKKKIGRLQNSIELFWALGATLYTLLSSVAQISIQGKQVTYEYNTFIYTVVTLIPILYILEGIIPLEKFTLKFKHTKPSEAKQARFVARGMLITTILAFSGNFIFTFFGIDTTLAATLVVALAPALYTITVGYAVFSLKLFNFRKFFIRIVVYGGLFTVIYGLFAGTILLIFGSINSINNGYFAFIAFPTTLVTYPLSRIIATNILSRLGRNPVVNQAEADKNLQDILRRINTDELLHGLVKTVRKQHILDSVAIALLTGGSKDGMKVVTDPGNDVNINSLKNLILNEIGQPVVNSITLKNYGLGAYQMAFIMKRDFVKGVILIGQKTNGRPIYDDDRSSILSTATQAALALENSLQYYKIQRFNEELEQKITDATRELRKTNDKLKALDEAKDEFISMASHQLRTPLTSVKGYVSMVLEGDAGKIGGQQKQLLEQAFTSSQRMVYLIADLLNVSRLKTGKFVIEATPTYLPDVVEGEMQQLTEAAKAHNIELTFDKPASFPTIKLDETKTRQVIMNFMDNAIYYTPAGGHIHVQLQETGKSVEFKVVDDGLGVPKAEQHHLFTKFYRAGNAKKARPDGTGLGLFMAKKVVIAQGGAIIFSSQEGKGSTFGFSFPLDESHTSSQAPAKPEH